MRKAYPNRPDGTRQVVDPLTGNTFARASFADEVRGLVPHDIDSDLALIARDVYQSDKRERPGISGWRPLSDEEFWRLRIHPGRRSCPITGFDADIYTDGFGRYVLAFRGTDELNDWAANLGQGLGFEAEQYNQARALAKKAKEALGEDLVITGHSLGGGLAAYAAAVTGSPTVTFNAAGVNDDTLNRERLEAESLRREAESGQIRRYAVEAEALSDVQEDHLTRRFLPQAIGRKIPLPAPDPPSFWARLNPFKRLKRHIDLHSMDSVIRAMSLMEASSRVEPELAKEPQPGLDASRGERTLDVNKTPHVSDGLVSFRAGDEGEFRHVGKHRSLASVDDLNKASSDAERAQADAVEVAGKLLSDRGEGGRSAHGGMKSSDVDFLADDRQMDVRSISYLADSSDHSDASAPLPRSVPIAHQATESSIPEDSPHEESKGASPESVGDEDSRAEIAKNSLTAPSAQATSAPQPSEPEAMDSELEEPKSAARGVAESPEAQGATLEVPEARAEELRVAVPDSAEPDAIGFYELDASAVPAARQPSEPDASAPEASELDAGKLESPEPQDAELEAPEATPDEFHVVRREEPSRDDPSGAREVELSAVTRTGPDGATPSGAGTQSTYPAVDGPQADRDVEAHSGASGGRGTDQSDGAQLIEAPARQIGTAERSGDGSDSPSQPVEDFTTPSSPGIQGVEVKHEMFPRMDANSVQQRDSQSQSPPGPAEQSKGTDPVTTDVPPRPGEAPGPASSPGNPREEVKHEMFPRMDANSVQQRDSKTQSPPGPAEQSKGTDPVTSEVPPRPGEAPGPASSPGRQGEEVKHEMFPRMDANSIQRQDSDPPPPHHTPPSFPRDPNRNGPSF